MTKPYREYVEQLKTACKDDSNNFTQKQLISYINEEYSKLSEIHTNYKKLLYLVVDSQLQQLNKRYTSRLKLQLDLMSAIEEIFNIKEEDRYRHTDKEILAHDIEEVALNLTDDYDPKLSKDVKELNEK